MVKNSSLTRLQRHKWRPGGEKRPRHKNPCGQSQRSFAGSMTLNRDFFWYTDHEQFFFLTISTRGALLCLLGFWPLGQNPAGAITSNKTWILSAIFVEKQMTFRTGTATSKSKTINMTGLQSLHKIATNIISFNCRSYSYRAQMLHLVCADERCYMYRKRESKIS